MLLVLSAATAVIAIVALTSVVLFTDWIDTAEIADRLGLQQDHKRGRRSKSSASAASRRNSSSSASSSRKQRKSSARDSSRKPSAAPKKFSVFRRFTAINEDAAATATASRRSHGESEALLDNFGLSASDDDVDVNADDDAALDGGLHTEAPERGHAAKRGKQHLETAAQVGGALALGAARGVGALLAAPVLVGGFAVDGAQQLRNRRGMPSFRLGRRDASKASKAHGDADSDDESSSSSRGSRRSSSEALMPAQAPRLPSQLASHALLKSQLKAHAGLTTAAAFSPNGQYVATAGVDGDPDSAAATASVRLLVRATLYGGEALTRFQTIPLPVDRDWVSCLAFSQDGFFMLAGTARSARVCIWRVFGRVTTKPALECVLEAQHRGPLNHVYMSTAPGEDAHFIATAGGGKHDRTLRFWSFNGAKQPRLLCKQDTSAALGKRPIAAVRFAASGKLLAVVGGASTVETDDHEEPQQQQQETPRCAFFALQFGQRGGGLGRKPTWTVSGLQLVSSLPADALAGVAAVDFGSRSSAAAVMLRGARWTVVKVRESRLTDLGHFEPTSEEEEQNAPRPFSKAALCEGRRMVVAARDADLFFFRLGRSPQDAAKLVEHVRGAHDSDVQEIVVAPDEEFVLSRGVNSQAARIWTFPSSTRRIVFT